MHREDRFGPLVRPSGAMHLEGVAADFGGLLQATTGGAQWVFVGAVSRETAWAERCGAGGCHS